MGHYRYPFIMLLLCFLTGSVLAGYYLWYRNYERPFACQANFVRHYPYETLSLWLNYTMNGKNGMLSILGRVKSEPNKIINRKITFQVERKGSIYYLTSEWNIKFPGDNVDDIWLEKYEPLFFIYPNKSIHMQIKEQKNNNYLFILGALPTTYVCFRPKG